MRKTPRRWGFRSTVTDSSRVKKGFIMELIVIGENRLKIMLTGEDMARYELADPDAEELAPHTREALRHIFADARADIGFDTDRERLLVQLFASKGGGCEIFVTRLEDTGETRLLKLVTGVREAMPVGRERRVWLRVGELDDLTALCRRLLTAGYGGESRLYIDGAERTVWYLSLALPVDGAGAVPCPWAFVWEYAAEVRGDVGMYLGEYGRLICGEGAVERMAGV